MIEKRRSNERDPGDDEDEAEDDGEDEVEERLRLASTENQENLKPSSPKKTRGDSTCDLVHALF